jgi:hypothetical protein
VVNWSRFAAANAYNNQITHGFRLYLKLRGLATEKFTPLDLSDRRCLASVADQQHRYLVQSRRMPTNTFSSPVRTLTSVADLRSAAGDFRRVAQ